MSVWSTLPRKDGPLSFPKVTNKEIFLVISRHYSAKNRRECKTVLPVK